MGLLARSTTRCSPPTSACASRGRRSSTAPSTALGVEPDERVRRRPPLRGHQGRGRGRHDDDPGDVVPRRGGRRRRARLSGVHADGRPQHRRIACSRQPEPRFAKHSRRCLVKTCASAADRATNGGRMPAPSRSFRRRAAAPTPGRARVPALRDPLRQGRLPVGVRRARVPVPLRVSWSSATRTSAACRRSSASRSTSSLLRAAEARAAGSARCARSGSRCRCAASRSRSCYGAERGELGCVNPEFHELPLGSRLSRSSRRSSGALRALVRGALPARSRRHTA